MGELRGDTSRVLERRPLGHIHHHLELALVVERQHLDGDELERHERRRREEQEGDAGQKCEPHAAVPDEAGHRTAIQPRGRALWRVAVSALGPKQAGGGPGVTMKAAASENSIAADAPTESAACRGPSAHRRTPSAESRRRRSGSRESSDCRPHRRRGPQSRRGLTHPPPSCGRAGQCSPRRRSHRRRGCRSRRSRRRA